MNRRQKIIVSVTGIFLVLLILLGLTYAYFLTQIQGNTNETSISVTTADLALRFEDGTPIVLTDSEIVPNTVVGEKTFSVRNTGNNTVDSYAVVLENLKVAYVNQFTDSDGNVITKDTATYLESPKDFLLKVTCNSSVEGKTCIGYDDVLPSTNDILLTNSIDEGELQTYTLTLTYKETGYDQSKDMNKKIEGRINIIDPNGTVDIEGTVSNYSLGDYVQLNSEPKISYINKDGKYKFVGVLPEEHKIAVYNTASDTPKGDVENNFTISSGKKENVNGNVITVTKDTRTINMDIKSDYNLDTIDESDLKMYNPYKTNTLAYSILNNASNSSDITIDLSDLAETKVANQISATIYGKTYPTSYPMVLKVSTLYIAYACDYTIDENGKFTLGTDECPVTLPTGKYVRTDAYAEALKGKYMVFTGSWASLKTDNVDVLYRMTDDVNQIKDNEFNYTTVYNRASTEKVLSKTIDDYGTSYYYRGGVENNYVNFAGMCWRIVRIQGDGSIKLILEDQDSSCQTADGNWNVPVSNETGAKVTGTFGYVKHSNGQTTVNYLNSDGLATDYENSMGTALKNFQTTKLTNSLNKLKVGDWCFADNAYTSKSVDVKTATPMTAAEKSTFHTNQEVYYYDTYVRLFSGNTNKPSLKCNGTKLDKWGDGTTDMYVGTLTADEIAYAGADTKGTKDVNFYLLNDFQRGRYMFWWALSPRAFNGTHESQYGLYGQGHLSGDAVGNDNGYRAFRPAVILKNNTPLASGNGTKNSPYVIES